MSLHQEVAKFRDWAATYPVESRSGEWECDYEYWGALHSEALSFVANNSPQDWKSSDVSDLLYAIARDNEIEYLAKEIAANPKILISLAKLSVPSPEKDAKWQLAAQLGMLASHLQEAESILLQFMQDSDEYVRRRALMSLGALKSPRAELFA